MSIMQRALLYMVCLVFANWVMTVLLGADWKSMALIVVHEVIALLAFALLNRDLVTRQ